MVLLQHPEPKTRRYVLKQALKLTPPDHVPQFYQGLVTTLRGLSSFMGGLNQAGTQRVLIKVQAASEAASKRMQAMVGVSFRQFVHRSMLNGAGVAHRWTRQDPKAPPLPDVVHLPDGTILHDPKEKMSHCRQLDPALDSRPAPARSHAGSHS